MTSERRCATCAFRPGTEASRDRETMALARLDIIARNQFDCHEQDRPCAGWLAAVQAARPAPPEDRRAADRFVERLTDLRGGPWFAEPFLATRRRRIAKLLVQIEEFLRGRS